jgi:hypothetical protein
MLATLRIACPAPEHDREHDPPQSMCRLCTHVYMYIYICAYLRPQCVLHKRALPVYVCMYISSQQCYIPICLYTHAHTHIRKYSQCACTAFITNCFQRWKCLPNQNRYRNQKRYRNQNSYKHQNRYRNQKRYRNQNSYKHRNRYRNQKSYQLQKPEQLQAIRRKVIEGGDSYRPSVTGHQLQAISYRPSGGKSLKVEVRVLSHGLGTLCMRHKKQLNVAIE